MNRSLALCSSLVMALAAGGMGVALAQRPVGLPDNYPNKPVRIIINMAPGGAIDNCGRAVATLLSKRWGSPVIAENVPGNGGVVSMATMMRAAPDGYTLLTTSSSGFAGAVLVEKVPYNIRTKFPPIAQCISILNIATVNNDLPVRNVKEFIAYAKANPNKLNYA
jgi:tripartite-type tricarboxylate transporter receptor subunit TctC